MSFYDNLRGTALALLTKFGQDVTLRKTIAGTYDENTGSISNTLQPSTLKGALFDFGDGLTTRVDTTIQQGDKECLLEAGGAIPTVDDAIVVGGVTYGILGVKEINPAGTPLLFKLHLRRS